MESLDLITEERFIDDQRRVLVSLTRTSIKLVHALSKDLEAQYRELEDRVGSELVERVYRAVDDLPAGLE